VPSFIMGLLVVLDTFIIYQIAKRRFDIGVALVASSLFAVMPATLVLRHIFLDNIMLPFILSSVLFALYVKINKVNNHLILLSGIFLGLAIYTKIPAFTMIPLVGFLIFDNSKRIKSLALWFVPVILIPCLWPAYALSAGQFNLWIDGITAQANRQGKPDSSLLDSFKNMFNLDPVFLIIGFAGVVYVAARKEYWLILWVIPLLIFGYFIGWVIYFHFVPIFPALCISAALLIMREFKFRLWRRLILTALISAIICFGLVVSILLISLDVNSYQFKTQAVVVESLSNNNTVFVGRQVYSWIPRYIFHISFDVFPKDSLPVEWNESKILFVDNGLANDTKLRDATKLILGFKKPKMPDHYPYTSITFSRSIWKKVDVRAN
ncbi:MAG: ArnT family glycosyltransferase, partial [Nitrososphaeraceae archaeon]